MQDELLAAPHRFLLGAVVPEAFTPAALRESAEQALRTPFEAFRLALRNGLAGPAWTIVEHLGLEDGIDPELRTQWASSPYAVAVVHSMARNQLAALGEALTASGVPGLLVGGLDFAARFYESPRLRSFTDIDLLVPDPDVDRAVSVLQGVGYFPPRAHAPLAYDRRYRVRAEYEHPQWPLPVSLQWALDSPFADTIEILDPLFAAAAPAPEVAAHVLCPCSPDALVLAAVQLRRRVGLAAELPGRGARLRAVIDAGALVGVLDTLTWLQTEALADAEELAERAALLGAQGALARAFRLAVDLRDVDVPDWAKQVASTAPAEASPLCRLVYPDLCQGRGVSTTGRRVRSLLFVEGPGLAVRPSPALAAVSPGLDAPRRTRAQSALRAGRLALHGMESFAAFTSWRLQAWLGRGAAIDGPS